MVIGLSRIASRKPLSTNGTQPAARGLGNQAIGTSARPGWGSLARYSPICRPMSYHDAPTLAARPASAMVIDGGQHRLVPAHLAQQVRQPVEGHHRAEDHRIHVGRLGAGLEQVALAIQVGVATGPEHLHVDAEPPGLIDHPVRLTASQ